MEISGRIQGGVVVLEGGVCLPEGTAVTVSCSPSSGTQQTGNGNRIQLPLVRTDRPATVHLSEDRVADLFDDEDVSSGH